MNAERLLAHFEAIAEAPDAIVRLRRFVLDLGVRGKLVPQDPKDQLVTDTLRTQKIAFQARGAFEIPASWVWISVGAVAKARLGKMLDKAKNRGTPRRYLRNANVRWFDFDLADLLEMPFEDSELSEFALCSGDVLICEGGEPGRAAVWDERETDIYFQKAIHRVRFLPLVNSAYFVIALKASADDRRLAEYFTGTGIKHFTGKGLESYQFPLPPLAEQRRIVAKIDELMVLCDRLEAARTEREAKRDRFTAASLGRLDVRDHNAVRYDVRFALDALAALTSRVDQVKELRQTILKLAIRGKLVPQDPNDEPAPELLKRIQREFAKLVDDGVLNKPRPLRQVAGSDQLFALPTGWTLARFNEIASIQSNLVDPKHYKRMPHIAPDNIESWTARLLPYQSIEEAGVFSGKHLFSAGAILYSKIRPNLAKVVKVDFDGLCSADMYPIHALIDRDFLVKFMITRDFVSQAVSEENRVAMPKINQAALSDILVAVPPLAEQHRIVAKLDELMGICDRLETSLSITDETRSRLLEALLLEALAPDRVRNLERELDVAI